MYFIVDIEYTNNTDDEVLPFFNVVDNFGEKDNMKSSFAESMNGLEFDVKEPIQPGETRTGKGLFIIKDDITEATVTTNPSTMLNLGVIIAYFACVRLYYFFNTNYSF